MAYVKKSIRNKFYDLNQKKEKPETFDESDFKNEVDWEQLVIHKNEVEVYLKSLKPEERELLYLIFVDEYTYKEISKKHQAPLGTVLARVHRLKKTLREKEVK